MPKNKWRHPIRYWEDMRRINELLDHMTAAHEECKKAADIFDDNRFAEQCVIFDACSAEVNRIWKKWKMGPYASQ